MGINVQQFMNWAKTQPAHIVYKVDSESGEPTEEVERTVPYLEHIQAEDSRFMEAFNAYREAMKAAKTPTSSGKSSSVSHLLTVDRNLGHLLHHAYSFGQGKSTELDVIKLQHDLVAAKNPGSMTLAFRIDSNALEVLTAKDDEGNVVLSDLAELILTAPVQTKG